MTAKTIAKNDLKALGNFLHDFLWKLMQLQMNPDNGGKTKSEEVMNNESANTKQPTWEREETVILVAEYFRTRNLSKSEQEKSIEFVSKLLRLRAKKLGFTVNVKYRNITGVEMKFANIMSLDKDTNQEGLKNVSTMEKQIVSEYYSSREKIDQEAYFTIMQYLEL